MNSRLSVQRILFGVATVAVLGFTSAVGQTIINVPPSPDPFVARSDEIVNVLPGGFLSSGFDALAGSQVNILGGGVGRFFESRTGSTTTITNGFVEQDWTVESGATANIGGGLIDDISAFSGAIVDVRGGAIGAIVSQSTAEVTVRGFDFRINGVPIDGLSIVGAERAFNMPEGSVLSGNYADGTPFAIKDRRNPRTGKAFADGTLRLVRSDVVAAQPGTIQLPGSAPPLGLREGQTLVVNDPEAQVPKHFTAGPGSIVELESGRISDNFSAIGSTVNIRGGTLGTFRALAGSTINISTGQAGTQLDGFNAFAGSVVNVSGGDVGGIGVFDGAELNVSGGVVSGFRAENGRLNITGGKFPITFGAERGSIVNISGGNFGRDGGFSDSNVTISGGTFGDDIRILDGLQSRLRGYDFRVDGNPVAGLAEPGTSVTVRLQEGQVFTGIFADGTPFLFSSTEFDDIYDEDLILELSTAVAPSPALIQVPNDVAPLGIRSGQTLVLNDGGSLDDNFNAGRDSTVQINGGSLGLNFESIGASVEVHGGDVHDMDLFEDSRLTVTGGTIGHVHAQHQSVVEVRGGEVGGAEILPGSKWNVTGGKVGLTQASGAELTMSGGELRGYASWVSSKTAITGGETIGLGAGENSTLLVTGGNHSGFTLTSGGSAVMEGGRVRDITVHSGSSAEIRGGNVGIGSNIAGGTSSSPGTLGNLGGTIRLFGGTFGDGIAWNSGVVELHGFGFEIDGQPVAGLDSIGNSVNVNLPTDALFTGTLADGTPLAFAAELHQAYFTNDTTVRLVRTAAPVLPTDVVVSNGAGPLGAASGQHVVLEQGGNLDDNFVAGAGSVVEIRGGTVGDNFESERSNVTISGGVVGRRLGVFDGGVVTLTGGTVDRELQVYAGGTFNLLGGSVDGEGKALGGTVNVSGGVLGFAFEAGNGSVVNISGGMVQSATAEGAIINVSGGEVGDNLNAHSGSHVNVSRGSVRNLRAVDGSNLAISGGNIDTLNALSGSRAEITGGSMGDDTIFSAGSNVRLVGLDFEVDGTLVAGLDSPGSEATLTVPANQLVTGTLADGTPFAFRSGGGEDENISSVRLVRAADTPAGPSLIDVPNDSAPGGVHTGQQLTLHEGGSLPLNFNAGRGSVVNIRGGTVGPNFEAFAAKVNIDGGQVGADFDAFAESEINIRGGNIDSNFDAYTGSEVNVTGGVVARLDALIGSEVNMAGGKITSLQASNGSDTQWTGGVIGMVSVNGATSTLAMHGVGFKINGTPIMGLDNEGDSVQFNLPASSFLTATLADGTPVALGNGLNAPGGNAQIANGTLRLVRSAQPPPGPAFQHVTGDNGPSAVGAGQTLLVDGQGTLPSEFVAGEGSIVHLRGGSVGANFRAFGADVNVGGSTIGSNFVALAGTDLVITGGTLQGFNLLSGAHAQIHGGLLPISVFIDAGAAVDIFGKSFLLNNQPIAGLGLPGSSVVLNQRGGQILTAILPDGSQLRWTLQSGGGGRGGIVGISGQAILRVHLVPEPATMLLASLAAMRMIFVCRRISAAIVTSGHSA